MFLVLYNIDGSVCEFQTTGQDCSCAEIIVVDGRYYLYDGYRRGYCFREVIPLKVVL